MSAIRDGVSDGVLLNSVYSVGGDVWACGGRDSNGSSNGSGSDSGVDRAATCVLAENVSGEVVSEYHFDWTSVTSVLRANSSIVISGQSTDTDTAVPTANAALCVNNGDVRLQCKVISFHDTNFVGATYVQLANVVVYVGFHNVYSSISIVAPNVSRVQSYIYTAYNMKSLTLSQMQSPPHFPGAFVAGTTVRAM